MVPQTQITEMLPGGLYVVAHQCGHDYTGPSGGYWFVGGLIHDGEQLLGARIRQTGLANITHYWAVLPGHEIVWLDGAWAYVPSAKPMAKADVLTASKPKRRKKKGRK